MRSVLCMLALGLALVAPVGCGGDGGGGGDAGGGSGGGGAEGGKPTDGKPGVVGVGRVLAQGTELGTTSVRGRAFHVEREALVLAGPKNSIFALGSARALRAVRRAGTPVIASGQIRRLTPEQARELAVQVDRLERRETAAAPPVAISRARRGAGVPYVAVRAIRLKQGAARGGKEKR